MVSLFIDFQELFVYLRLGVCDMNYHMCRFVYNSQFRICVLRFPCGFSSSLNAVVHTVSAAFSNLFAEECV